jgi:NhaP-type Na+/H+ or K+/H+ antiporter
MEGSQQVLASLALIIILGVGGQWLAWRLRIPAILLLLSLGCLAGSILGWVQPNELFGDLLQPMVSLAVGFILFEGGLSLKLTDLATIWKSLLGLLTVGVLLTWIVGSAAAYWILGVPPSVALVLGAVLTVTGPTVIGPLLREIRPAGKVGIVAKWEGIVVDPIGATLAVLVFETTEELRDALYGSATISAIYGFAITAISGIAIGIAAGWLLVEAIRRFWVPDYLRNPITLLFVACCFIGAEITHHEAGLVSATVMGMWLANQKKIDVHGILEFKESITVLLISLLFIVLAARIPLSQISELGWQGVMFAAVMILVARPLSVMVSTFGSGMAWQERVFLSWFAPRGIVAAAVSSVFALRMGDEGAVIAPATFVVILSSVTIYGLTAGWLARRLGLAKAEPQGVLIAGANEVARAMGLALQREGIACVLVDTRYDYTARAREAGIGVQYANVLSDYVMEEIDFGGLGRFLALTPNDNVNTLSAAKFREVFGTSNVYQLASRNQGERFEAVGQKRFSGRTLFAKDLNYATINTALQQGGVIKATRITKQFTYAEFRETHTTSRPLFVVNGERLVVITADIDRAKPTAGNVVIHLVLPAGAESSDLTRPATKPL